MNTRAKRTKSASVAKLPSNKNPFKKSATVDEVVKGIEKTGKCIRNLFRQAQSNSPEKAKTFLLKAGIIDKNGALSKPYQS